MRWLDVGGCAGRAGRNSDILKSEHQRLRLHAGELNVENPGNALSGIAVYRRPLDSVEVCTKPAVEGDYMLRVGSTALPSESSGLAHADDLVRWQGVPERSPNSCPPPCI